jgi:TRAP-type mannitol/chloroaromatic compound transport system substrate-binding protein
VPGGDVLAAFDKGSISAAELYPPAVDERQGLKDKIKLIYMPGWHQPETVLELLVNKDRWDGLTDRERGLIEGACLATLQSTLADNAKLEADALAKIAKAGVRVEPWPQDVLAALRSAWTEIAKEEGDRDYFFRTVFDDIEKFRTKANSASAPNASAEPDASAEAKAAP